MVHDVYQAFLVRQQFMGCDRELTMLLCVVCAALALCSVDVYITAVSAILFGVVFYLLKMMADKDLMLRQVYLRSLRYRKLYTAQANLHCINPVRY